MKFIHDAVSILRKDILLEIRGKESLSLMLFLSLLFLVIFNFALDIDKENVSLLASGILWVIFSFTGILGMGRTSMSERDEEAYLSVVFSPVSPESFYAGKVLSNLLFLLLMEAFTLIFFAILFDFEKIITLLPQLLPVLLLGTLGFALVGTLFSFLATASRYGEVLLPFLYLPVVVPVILGGVSSMDIILNGKPGGPGRWLQIMVVFDMLYLSLSLLLFRYIIED
ncbi:MAG TPA: cytochrome C biogenesis protein [Nitrospirae bacterium]|nr:cytochrome C biogenesis protein [Nitrospirota bacterium]